MRSRKPCGTAQVLADDEAAAANALERGDAREIGERVVEIGACRGRRALRDHVEPLERHDMVDAQRAGVPHVGAQQLDEAAIAARPQALGMRRRQTPLLARLRAGVGRRADVQRVHHEVPLGPGLGTRSVGADGEVAIQADTHRLRPRRQPPRAAGRRAIVATRPTSPPRHACARIAPRRPRASPDRAAASRANRRRPSLRQACARAARNTGNGARTTCPASHGMLRTRSPRPRRCRTPIRKHEPQNPLLQSRDPAVVERVGCAQLRTSA